MSSFISCDPGLSGALCWWEDHKMVYAEVMPIDEDGVDVNRLDRLMVKHSWLSPRVLVVEEIFAGSQMSRMSALSFGMNFGRLLTVFELADFEIRFVPNREWTKVMHEGVEKKLPSKEKSRLVMKNQYSAYTFLASSRSKKMHEGMMDAFLLGEYWLRKNGGKTE